jgi:hypothetical protein
LICIPYITQCHEERDETTIAESSQTQLSKRGETGASVCT